MRTLQQQSADSVPLLGGDKGAKEVTGEEEEGEEEEGEPADRWKWQSDKQNVKRYKVYIAHKKYLYSHILYINLRVTHCRKWNVKQEKPIIIIYYYWCTSFVQWYYL